MAPTKNGPLNLSTGIIIIFFPIILTCNMRQKNSIYNNLLNHIAHGTQLEYTIKTLNEIFSTTPMPKSIKLCPIRREADQINQTRLSEIDTENIRISQEYLAI